MLKFNSSTFKDISSLIVLVFIKFSNPSEYNNIVFILSNDNLPVIIKSFALISPLKTPYEYG